MRHSSSNPAANILPTSANESALVQALESSGYPLQGVVAEKLQVAGFRVVEEWGFIDADTKEHRSIDILG